MGWIFTSAKWLYHHLSSAESLYFKRVWSVKGRVVCNWYETCIGMLLATVSNINIIVRREGFKMLTHVQITSTRPVTTAHLAQTMTLLSLPIDELAEQIETELSNNPALEMLEERRCPTCHRPLPEKGVCPICSRPTNVNPEEPVVFISTREDFFPQGEVSCRRLPGRTHFTFGGRSADFRDASNCHRISGQRSRRCCIPA